MPVLTEEDVRELTKNLTGGDSLTLSKDKILTPSAKAYLTERNIAVVTKKSENKTHLHGNVLVNKTHPRINLRGMTDLLEAQIIRVQICHEALASDLQEIVDFIRKIMAAEVRDEPLGDFTLHGLTIEEIREHSHHTTKYYGISHFLPSSDMGGMVADLNLLRTITRRVELAACHAFAGGERNDIITAYNRLSSLFWIMMCEVQNGKYNK